jgi:hypothetical protein
MLKQYNVFCTEPEKVNFMLLNHPVSGTSCAVAAAAAAATELLRPLS